MERDSRRSKRTESGWRPSDDLAHRRGTTEWDSSRNRDRGRPHGTKNSSSHEEKRLSRTAPSSPEPRRASHQVAARSHSTSRPSPRHRSDEPPRPSASRRYSTQEDEERRERRAREREDRSGGDGVGRSHKHSSRDSPDHEDAELRERQVGVYQKALKEQIVQSDHLIKAIYRFSDCIDMTEKAMRNLHDVMGDYWEDDWPSSEKYYITLQDQEELWDRYEQSMRKLLDPIREYEDQFEGAEDKIEEYQVVRRQFSQACATLEELRRRRASGSDITFAESDRDRIGQRYQQLVHFLGKGLPKIIASRIPFMEKLFYNLSNNLLQFCLETCKVQSKSCSIISKLRSYDLSIVLGEGRSRTTIRAPARQPGGGARANSTHAPRPGFAFSPSPEVSRVMEVIGAGDAQMANDALLQQILEADGPDHSRGAAPPSAGAAGSQFRPIQAPQGQWGLK